MLSRWTFSGYMDHAPRRCLSNSSDGVLDDNHKAYPDLVYTLNGRLGGPAEYKGEEVIEPKRRLHFLRDDARSKRSTEIDKRSRRFLPSAD